jgi:hypothetical protein
MAHLRIVTWNCGMALARKVPNLLALNPDIAVVQECSKNSLDVLQSNDLSGLWFGANLNKGVAVFCSKDFTLHRWANSLANGWFPFGFMGKWISICLRSGPARSGLSVRTITSVRFSDASWNKVAGSGTHPLWSLEISTVIRNGTRTAPDGTTRKLFAYSKATV